MVVKGGLGWVAFPSFRGNWAFGCAIYTRSKSLDGSFAVELIAAKSKVSPLKTISLPRLELNGAVMLTELVDRIKRLLDDKLIRCICGPTPLLF